MQTTNKMQSAALAIFVMLCTALFSYSSVQAAEQDFLASASEPHGVVISGLKQSGKLIFPVEIYRVNGQRINFRGSSLPLQPGSYELQAGRAVVDRGIMPGLHGDVSRPDTKPLQLEVEAGKAYYIGLKADSSRGKDWQLVVWKSEPGGRGFADSAEVHQ